MLLCYRDFVCKQKQFFSCFEQLGSWKGLAMYGVQCWNPLSKGVAWWDWLLLSMGSLWNSLLVQPDVVLFCQSFSNSTLKTINVFFLQKSNLIKFDQNHVFDQIWFLDVFLNMFNLYFVEMFWITIWVFQSRYWHENHFSQGFPFGIGDEKFHNVMVHWDVWIPI